MIYLKSIASWMIGVLLFLVLRLAAQRLLPLKPGPREAITNGTLFWVLVALFFLAGAALYSQIRGIVFYTAHIPG
jgi:hypothetical protein